MDWKIAHICCNCRTQFACKFDSQTRYCCYECGDEKSCKLKNFSLVQIDLYGLCLDCEIELMEERELQRNERKLFLVK